MNKTTKSKSANRFKQVNYITKHVIQTLPTPLSIAVLMIAWRHADERFEFQVSTGQFAGYCSVSVRQIQKTLSMMREGGVIELVKQGYGTTPAVHRVTGKQYTPPSEGRTTVRTD
jgi:hypothetical protein